VEVRVSDDAAQAERIKQLVELACIARGWSRQALAAHLGRDVSRLVPEGGNPKLDYVMKLADALEWPVGDVAQAIWGHARTALSASKPNQSYDELRSAAHHSFVKAEFRLALESYRLLRPMARNADEQAHAIGNEAACHNMLGRHIEAAEVANHGLSLDSLSPFRRLHLQSNLVLALVKLRRLDLALGLAGMIISRVETVAKSEPRALREGAFAVYSKAYCHLQLGFVENDLRQEHLRNGAESFRSAKAEFVRAAQSLSQSELNGMSGACDAGLLECEVELGALTPSEALRRVFRVLDESVSLDDCGNAYSVESFGWWAIAGASIALRHLSGGELQHAVAVCTEKALEIAELTDNWHLRERAFTIQYLGQRRLSDLTGLKLDYLVDDEDRTQITSLMGRFPGFRGLGWKILESQSITRRSGGSTRQ
jgi:tetratricopeptide (TPR) repeat protein